ncbi:DNA topoisomerase 2-associated protein pat1 [Smittium culicis]|uniref:DNA topoisomerase 2-associated protein pat1 n=1 Tax=Smittium culicis TaxID=133412 RepID=A0A1R1Y509_9FUNG|nr:DNA topoisomerase 2-associated protein pat1 [Smittium culicis]
MMNQFSKFKGAYKIEPDDSLNDETFGDNSANFHGDFDFFNSTFNNINLNDLQAKRNDDMRSVINEPSKKVYTLEEIESQIITNMRNKQLEDQHLQLKNEEKLKMELLKVSFDKYRGLMTQGDKDHVLRVQISQIFAEDSGSDSFYSHMFKILRSRADSQSVSSERASYGLNENRVHLQLQRMINDARRRKPKANTVILDGALGKITAKTSRNPKQVIQIEKEKDILEKASERQPIEKKEVNNFSPETDKRKTLQMVEDIYDSVLVMEQIIRDHQVSEVDYNRGQNWHEKYNSTKDFIWDKLELEKPVSSEFPHPFVRILSVSKGKRIIPRIVHHFTSNQMLALVTTVVANFESLDVCKLGRRVSVLNNESNNLFMMFVMPAILTYLSEAPMSIVNGLLALLMDRNSIAWVARTKPGMSLMTLLLSRAEVLKQSIMQLDISGSHPASNESQAEVNEQNSCLLRYAELYGVLFRTLQNHLPTLMPSPYTTSFDQMSMEKASEDGYIWQFLASLAVSASVEQQHVLVGLAREVVIERVAMANSVGIHGDFKAQILANVNTFLNSLGLDSSQISF